METGVPDSFNLVSWEVDTTGRLLCDEMFRMSSFFRNSKFDVYIMPYRDISFYVARRLQVVTATSGLYRFLKKRRTGKIVRSKTEYFGLMEFLSWLEKISDKPIVLMCYEPYDFAPFILIQALERYDMLDKFKKMVFGFAHVYGFVKKKCKRSMSSLSLQPLAKVLLNKDVVYFDSLSRTKLVHEILMHLCAGDSKNPEEILTDEVKQYIRSVDEIEKELVVRKRKLFLQISLKPIFFPYLKFPESRRKALKLRNFLIQSDIAYGNLQTIWTKGRDAFKSEVQTMLSSAGDEVTTELLAILLYHFDNENANPKKNPLPRKIEELVQNLSLCN